MYVGKSHMIEDGMWATDTEKMTSPSLLGCDKSIHSVWEEDSKK